MSSSTATSLMLSFTDVELNGISVDWSLDVGRNLFSNFKDIQDCRYVIAVVDGDIKMVCEVEQWSVPIDPNAPYSARLTAFTLDVSTLTTDGDFYYSNPRVIGGGKADLVSRCFKAKKARPTTDALFLTLDQAANAVARYHRVDPDQVCISIHRK